jgi:hypothetical protein
MTAVEIQSRLEGLTSERALAKLNGLAADSTYMADLDDEIACTCSAFVGTAVVEIAVLRAELSGPALG